MDRLTKQEQIVLLTIIGLLLVGWGIKAYRSGSRPPSIVQNTGS